MLRRTLAAAVLAAPLAACGDSSSPHDEPTDSAESAWATAEDAMRAACLAALPDAGDASGDPLDAASAVALAARTELARAFLEIYVVRCHLAGGRGAQTPFCMRHARHEAIDPSRAPAHAVAEGRSYRHAVARFTLDAAGEPALEIASTSSVGSTPTWTVTGPFDDLTATLAPGPSSVLADELMRVDSYRKLELHGRITDRELVLTRTRGTTVVWNTASCARAVLRASFDPAAAPGVE